MLKNEEEKCMRQSSTFVAYPPLLLLFFLCTFAVQLVSI